MLYTLQGPVILATNGQATEFVVLENVNIETGDNLATIAQTICVSANNDKETKSTTVNGQQQSSINNEQIVPANTTTATTSTTTSTTTTPSTVNIIRYVTNSNEVPTIHIVDSLENEEVVKKIEGAFGRMNSADIKSIEELVNDDTGNKDDNISLSFLDGPAIAIPESRIDSNNTDDKNNDDKDPIGVERKDNAENDKQQQQTNAGNC